MSSGNDYDTESSTLSTINWKKETVLVIFSAIVGGLIFSAVSPFIVPFIHDIQVEEFGVQKPTVGIEVEYTEGVDGERFTVPTNESYDKYTITIQNPTQKQVRFPIVGFVFPGVIEAQRVGQSQLSDGISYSKNAQLVARDSADNFSYSSNAIKSDKLPPLKEISATFLVDRTPEEIPIPGYWKTKGLTNYRGSKGTLMITGQYQWQFKGSIYSETKEYVLVNESHGDSHYRYDVCVGESPPQICK